MAQSSLAADLLDYGLRGSVAPTYRWAGVYGGVQGGYSSANINFGTSATSDIAFLLRNTAIEQDQQISQWATLGPRTPSSASLGAFVGYNGEWESVILGVEMNYSHLSLSASSRDSVARSFTDSTNLPAGHHDFYRVNVTAQSSLHVTDITTFRARAGWEVGSFLPYGFAAVAVGRANISSSGTVSYSAFDTPDVQTPPTPQLIPLAPLLVGPVSQADVQNGALTYGFAAGLGTDVALWSNIFLRGEWEYLRLGPLKGTTATVNSLRTAIGMKF